MLSTVDQFTSRVAAHHGGAPVKAITAVLAGLGALLGPGVRELVAEELPEPLGDAMHRSSGVPLSLQPRELVASVCHVLAEELSDEARDKLAAQVPGDIARLLDRPSAALDEHGGLSALNHDAIADAGRTRN